MINVGKTATWLLCFALFGVTFSNAFAQADSRFDSADPAKAPHSVPLADIQERIQGDPAADGVVLTIETVDGVMRIDIKEMPGSTSVAAATRIVFMVARLAVPVYTEMRFVDEGTDVFVIDGEAVRAIGREFLWGEREKGQNPIHLIRLFTDALRYPDGTRVAPVFRGSLMGDTSMAMSTMADIFIPGWVVKTTKML